MVNVPWLVNTFFKLITPFIDPLTRPKLRFNPNCLSEGFFSPDQLLSEWGGSAHFEYDHAHYWDALVRMCAERRELLWEKWRERGAKVGVQEWDVKCAVELDEKQGRGSGEGSTPGGADAATSAAEQLGETLVVMY